MDLYAPNNICMRFTSLKTSNELIVTEYGSGNSPSGTVFVVIAAGVDGMYESSYVRFKKTNARK
jgi:hypothetical protein